MLRTGKNGGSGKLNVSNGVVGRNGGSVDACTCICTCTNKGRLMLF